MKHVNLSIGFQAIQSRGKRKSDLIVGGSKDPMKQTKAHEMKLKQPQNAVRLSLKLTLGSKRNITNEKHRREGHLQRKNNLLNLGNEANRRMSTLDMF
jgi:hypothetical protein